jgi:hypothetical protein
MRHGRRTGDELPRAVMTGPSGSDFTGMLATAAGVVLVACAFRDAVGGRRLAVRLVFGALGILVIVQWLSRRQSTSA